MTTHKIVLSDQSGKVSFNELQLIAKAIQTQVQDHFSDVWNVSATVSALAPGDSVPVGHWPVFVKDSIELANAWGFHWLDDNGIPYAEILFREDWSITASHEILEMLVNPNLDRYQVADITPLIDGNEVFLLEVAGPVQSKVYGYRIDGILVSNFFFPSYFDLLKVTGKKYDYLGVIQQPRSILEGGYVSFIDNLGQWWQAFMIQNKVDLRRIGAGSDNQGQTQDRVFRGIVSLVISAIVVYITLKLLNRNDTTGRKSGRKSRNKWSFGL